MTTGAITEDEAELTYLGLCIHCKALCEGELAEPHHPDCPMVLGLGVARGDRYIPSEVCAGPCARPLEPLEPYATVDGSITCLPCTITTTEGAV